ncbi:MAG TPA: PQQ-dependent sugar dehydrogenase, partial [Trueperaceae bacterium]
VLAGKTVRINPDGSIPPDNPFVGKAGARPEIWTYGHRNPQGLAFDPASGMLYSTEHGEDTDDELNLLEPGNNYGWPIVRGTDDGGGKYTPALASYYPCPYTPPASETCDPFSTIAISSLTFYQGAMFPDWQGDILFVSLKTGRLYHVTLSPDGRSVADSEVVLDDKDATYPADAQLEHDYGRLRAIAVAPDGSVYISTSNGDGQDFLLRLSGE